MRDAGVFVGEERGARARCQSKVAKREQSEVDEERLIEASRRGDEIAFGRLVERHKEVVFATIAAITRDFDGAHDIAQETFLRAWFGMAGLQEASSFAAWLRSIARNRARTWLERRQRQPLRENVELDQVADQADSPERNAEKNERKRLVMTALEKLPEGSRETLMLYYMEDLPTPQIAVHLGIAVDAVRQRLRRARQQLQKEVEIMVADVIKEETPGADFTESVAVLLKRSKGLFEQVQCRAAAPVLEAAREQAPTHTLVSMLLADAYHVRARAGGAGSGSRLLRSRPRPAERGGRTRARQPAGPTASRRGAFDAGASGRGHCRAEAHRESGQRGVL